MSHERGAAAAEEACRRLEAGAAAREEANRAEFARWVPLALPVLVLLIV